MLQVFASSMVMGAGALVMIVGETLWFFLTQTRTLNVNFDGVCGLILNISS